MSLVHCRVTPSIKFACTVQPKINAHARTSEGAKPSLRLEIETARTSLREAVCSARTSSRLILKPREGEKKPSSGRTNYSVDLRLYHQCLSADFRHMLSNELRASGLNSFTNKQLEAVFGGQSSMLLVMKTQIIELHVVQSPLGYGGNNNISTNKEASGKRICSFANK